MLARRWPSAAKIYFLAKSLPYSDACFVTAYRAITAAFCDGHVVEFSFFGGVSRSILYGGTRITAACILDAGKRRRTSVFSELRSHYLFKDWFDCPGKRNDKGKVEGQVGYSPRYFLVPMSSAGENITQNDRALGRGTMHTPAYFSPQSYD